MQILVHASVLTRVCGGNWGQRNDFAVASPVWWKDSVERALMGEVQDATGSIGENDP